MVISNIGSIVLSLPYETSAMKMDPPPIADSTSSQVKYLSLANTISRLVAGPLADYISPVTSYLHVESLATPRKHLVSRMVFMSGSTLLLALTFAWFEMHVRSRPAITFLRYVTLID